MKRLAPGLWRWTARHPEWHPGDFGAEVACYAARAGDETLLIDPLVVDDAALDEVVADTKRVSILITIPYHTRSAESLAGRYGAAIWGHPAVAKRLGDASLLREMTPDTKLPGGARAFAIGRPRRYEMPLFLPSHDALVFGDAVVEHGGALRVWAQEKLDARRRRFYAERFIPTLAPLLELEASRVLVTHGEPVLTDGTAALAAAEPWYHHG